MVVQKSCALLCDFDMNNLFALVGSHFQLDLLSKTLKCVFQCRLKPVLFFLRCLPLALQRCPLERPSDNATAPLRSLFVPTAFRDVPALAESLPQTIFQHLGKTVRGNSNDACRPRATDPMAKPLVENILFLHFAVPDGRVSSCRVLFCLVLFAACSRSQGVGLTFTLSLVLVLIT